MKLHIHEILECPSICPCVRACYCKLFLQKTSQKLLTGFLRNFTGMFFVMDDHSFRHGCFPI